MTRSSRPKRVGVKTFVAGSILAQICALARYTILARLLGPQELGMAAILILTAQFFDAVSDTGADRYLIQHDNGNSPELQAMVQLTYLSRGTITATTLILFAHPIASFYHAPEVALGLQVLALVPFVTGFMHLDMRRVQREHNFHTEGLNTLFSEILSLIATTIAAYYLRNFTAILYGLSIRAITMLAVSHLNAERRYKIGFVPQYSRSLALFSIPLMLNGVLLFAGGQTDRVLIGHELGLAQLGRYSAILLLIYYPTAILGRNVSSLFLPRISGARSNPAEATAEREFLGGLVLLSGLCVVIGFTAVGGIAAHYIYGPKYDEGLVVVSLIGALQTSRYVRYWPTTLALAATRSNIVLTGNLLRLIGLPLAVGAIYLGWSIQGLVACFFLGEMVALASALFLLNKATHVPVLQDFVRVGIFLTITCSLIAASIAYGKHEWILGSALVGFMSGAGWYAVVREKATLVRLIQILRRSRKQSRHGTDEIAASDPSLHRSASPP